MGAGRLLVLLGCSWPAATTTSAQQAKLLAPPGPQPPALGAWYTGQYRNLFAERGSHSEAQAAAKVEGAFEQLFHGNPDNQALYYYTDATQTEAYILTPDTKDVRSEGMSYGMMIAVQLDKQREFDALFAFAKKHMQHTSHSDPRSGYFAWRALPSGQTLDPNPASDGEMYFATALYFAANRWGSKQGGGWNYRAEADSILHACIHKEDGGKIVRGVTNMFNTRYKQVVFVPHENNADFTDPSYHIPAFTTVWSVESSQSQEFWSSVGNSSRKFFRAATDQATALCPDYSTFGGEATGGAQHSEFRFDAWRCAMNVAVDFAWFGAAAWEGGGGGGAWPSDYANRLHSFFASQGGARSNYGNQYTLSGQRLSSTHSVGLVAMNAVAALAATEPAAWEYVEALWSARTPSGEYRYYDGMLYMLGLLHVSGNFKIYANTSHPIPGWYNPAPPAPPGPPGPESACEGALGRLCASARRSSAGNCFVCCGVHQQALMGANCSEADFDRFCS